ncbi:MAG: alanine--tRNA ligase [Sulfolobales archaeon]
MVKLGEPSEYRLRYFIDSGFRRAICRSCNTPFWSRGSHETCNDTPCSEYRFFDIDLKLTGLSYEKALETFLKFFEKEGHRVIEPAPVVARWREDLYLTIASIVVFQPHVTSGKVPPPANPLVIAQPCIRLEDIDNVGRTFGRHMTNFTMGGHHAFNYKDKHLYWKDETVEYARRFFVDLMGVPDEELTFKESWWEGGGNAGPSLEVTVGGLEVATLVFMQYEVREDGTLVELPLKIVDTGYGIERIAWLSQKSPTAFHAVYGRDLVSEFHRILGIPEARGDLLILASRKAGRIDPDDPSSIKRLFSEIARETGYSEKTVEEELGGAINVYSVIDHTKTIALMLSDGIVPSNSGEGYLARLVARRTMRTLRRLGIDVSLAKLVDLQVRRWGDLYPRLRRSRSYVLEATELEEERFRDIIRKAPAIIARYQRGGLSTEDLVEIYDSHGVPPEIIEEEMRSRGVEISLPHNFYSIVASRHMRAPVKKKEEIEKEIAEWASRFNPTRRLFHEDPYMKSFSAEIHGIRGDLVILDATCFYPTGGGQRNDTGLLVIGDLRVRVTDVFKIGDVVIHRVDRKLPEDLVGSNAEGIIDWERRYRIMRHHTATHALLGALRKIYGDHVWQAGAEKTEEKGRLDITHHLSIGRDDVKKIEAAVNKIIDERRPVRVKYMDRYEAENKYGYSIYQGGVPQEKILRIVEIDDWDAEACFGTHLANTGEIGGFKIVNVERIADGVLRFEYVAGTRSAEQMSLYEDILDRISRITGGGVRDDLVRRVEALNTQLEKAKGTLSAYRTEWIRSKIAEARSAAENIGMAKLYVITNPPEVEGGREILKILSQDEGYIALMIVQSGDESNIEVSVSRDILGKIAANSLVDRISRILGGRGGGSSSHATGRIRADADTILRVLRNVAREMQQS